jgi:hypothetical protein
VQSGIKRAGTAGPQQEAALRQQAANRPAFTTAEGRADAHPARGCEVNPADLVLNPGKGLDADGGRNPDLATEPRWRRPERLQQGRRRHSHAACAPSQHRSRIRYVFSWAGAIGSSEIADKLAELGVLD